MSRLYNISVFIIISALTVQVSYSIELSQTPIQNQLKNSILLAADSWNLDGKKDADNNYIVTSQGIKQKKSAFKAALYSALLPGLGEHYVGNRTKAKVFFTTEALTWMSYIAFRTYGDWKKDDMVRYAAGKAGATLDGKNDEYFDWVGFYNSTEDFNSLGRVSDPSRAYLTGSDNYWQWESDNDRENFRSLKNSSRTAYNRAGFMVVAAIGNRIISIIDAIRDAKRANSHEKIDISEKKSYNYKFAVDPLSYNRQFSITVYTPF